MVLPWFTTCFPHVFHMFSTCFPCVSPHFFPAHLRGLLGLGLGLDPGRLSLVDKLVAGEPDRILRRLLEKGWKNVEKMWKKCGMGWQHEFLDAVIVNQLILGKDGKGDSTWLQNGGFVISIMPKMARIRQDLELKSKQHRHLVGIYPNN